MQMKKINSKQNLILRNEIVRLLQEKDVINKEFDNLEVVNKFWVAV